MQTLRRKTSPFKSDKGGAIRFMGDGVSFKAKLIGILEVSEARGDRMCQEALFDLKMAIRAAGEHKQRITINVAIDGLKLRDEKTGDCLYHHPIHKISFIAQDMVDSRAFGYIFGSPDTGHRFFGIKTDKAASQVVITMRDLFQTVFELKKQEIEMTRQQQIMKGSGLYLEALASTTSKTDHISCNDDGSKRFNRDLSSLEKSEFKNTIPNANDLLNLELELNNLQQGLSQMDSITPPSSDPFGDSFTSIPTVLTKLPPPPSFGERRTRNSSATSSGQPEKHWFDKETESIFSLTNPSEVRQSLQSSDFKVNESVNRTSPIKSDAFDVFTELDPLGTGRSKPYVDKKDFFQELKNPPKKILNQLAGHENEKISEQQPQNLPTKAVSHSFSSDLSFKDSVGFIEDPFKNDNFIKSHDSNSVEMEFADFSSFESLKPVSPQLQHKSPLLKSDSSSSQNSAQGLLKVSLPPETQKPYNISSSPKYNLMSKNRSKLKMRKTPSPDYYRNEDPISPEDDYAIMKLMTLPQRIDVAPEPPPRPSSSLEPPPLPPKKQQVSSKNVKPIRTRNNHYDYIENYVSSYSLPSTQQDNEAPPLPLPSRKPKNDIKKKKEELDSEYYLVPVSVRKTSNESKSNGSTSLDITLSQLTKTGFSDLADTLRISPTSLSKMTLKELTLRLSKLTTTNGNEEPQSVLKKTEEEKKEPEKSLYDKYAVFRELLDEEKTDTGIKENDKYAALRDIPMKDETYEEESAENFPIEKNHNSNISEQAIELNNDQVSSNKDENVIDEEVVEIKNVEDDQDDDEDDDIGGNDDEDDDYEEQNHVIKKEDVKEAIECETIKDSATTTVIENPELIENNASQKLFDNSQCWATFDVEPETAKKITSPWSTHDQEQPIPKPKVNLKKVSSNRSKCSSSWDDCEESEDNWDNAKRSLESSIEDFPQTENGWSDGESMYEDEPYYGRKHNRRSNRKISPRHREPSPWDEKTRYSDEWEPPYMFPPHWRVPHMDDERRRSSKDDKRRIYARPDIDRRVQKIPSTPNWDDEKYQRLMYERRRRYLEEQYNWDRYGPPIPKGYKNYPRPPPIDNSDDDDIKMRYRLPRKNRYISTTTPRKPRRSYHRRSEGSDEERNIPPRKPYSQEELDLSESELEQNWSRRSTKKWSLKRNQTSPFDDNFTPDSPDSSLFTKTVSTCSDLGYLTKPSPSTSSKTNRNARRPKRSDSGHRSIDSNSKIEASKRSPFEDDFTPDNAAAKGSISSEFSFKDDDVFTAKEVKIPQEEISSSPKEMKKSESINIFARNTDPFEDDEFFTQEVSSKPNLASLEEAISDRESEEWDKKPDRTKNE
ncbi:uncharacterized protein LOC112689198 isoform X3 [Sipha flava]|uniref:Uncharacterized protein LOC112689198 isoform X3 n=2 Tax=Sipha flava TaxID=143950 RepID=A0A8B8G5Q1_9HEMI|nr:uncharacterized protein LOC112689198 isoform X3 [Sipha flava]